MSRYVDADKMIENTKAMRSLADAIAIDGIIKYIEDNIVPDVEQVKHGERGIESNEYGDCMICSKCNFESYNNIEKGNTIEVYGYFNTADVADKFMEHLDEFINADMEIDKYEKKGENNEMHREKMPNANRA